METNETTGRVPNMMESILLDQIEHSRKMRAEMEALIRECREALGETSLEDTGFRRREFRDRPEPA